MVGERGHRGRRIVGRAGPLRAARSDLSRMLRFCQSAASLRRQKVDHTGVVEFEVVVQVGMA